jgi:hypothetical protein
MVHLTTVRNGFHGRVIAARLGADGILTELRGGIDGPYPMGDVEVLVPEDELDEALALLQADLADAAARSGAGADGETAPARLRRRTPLRYWVAAFLVLAAVVGLLGHL